MGKLEAKEVAQLCEQVADVIETDPKGAALVARRLAAVMDPRRAYRRPLSRSAISATAAK